jgi:thiosulfate/3-mercaptopyruvate sulfurtransferase
MRVMLRGVAAICALLVASTAMAQSRESRGPLLVSTAWLADHLHDPDLVLVQTSQSSPSALQIPGARLLPHASLMTMGATHDLAAPADLIAALERVGVSNDSHVVVYGEPLAAGWLFFALDYLGHKSTSLLDGGLDKWQGEDRPVGPPTSAALKQGHFQPRISRDVKATSDAVLHRGPGVTVLDARSDEEYQAGHIPGAHVLTWQMMYADPKLQVLKSRSDIAALFENAGVTATGGAITYCQIGLRSSLLYFAARYAGVKVSNYVGSWSEWTTRGLPTAPPSR